MTDRAITAMPGLGKMVFVLNIPACRQAGVFWKFEIVWILVLGIWCLEF